MRLSLPSCLLFLSTAMCAQGFADGEPAPINQQEFKWGITVTPADDRGLQSLLLPRSYYLDRFSTNDIRIFDNTGNLVPFAIIDSSTNQIKSSQKALPFYPVARIENVQNTNDSHYAVNIQSADISVQIDNHNDVTAETSLYILDLGEAPERIPDELEFFWNTPANGFVKNISLKTSDNLNQWSDLLRNQSLSRFFHSGTYIGNNRIQLSKAVSRYILLEVGSPDFSLDKVVAHSRWSEIAPPPTYTAIKPLTFLTQAPDADQSATPFPHKAGYSFTVPDGLHNFSIGFADAGNNYFYSARVSSISAQNPHWQSLGEISRFNLQMEELLAGSSSLDIDAQPSQHFFLTFTIPESINETSAPQVEIFWQPDTLIFLHQGNAPYTLAFGRNNTPPPPQHFAGLFKQFPSQELDDLQTRLITLPEPQLSGTGEPLKQQQPFNWKTPLLWLTLIVAVVTMLLMAKSLYQQMNNRGDQP